MAVYGFFFFLPSEQVVTLSSRRRFLVHSAAQAAVLAAASGSGGVWAKGGRPLRILVGFPPGGGSDVIARLLQEPLSELLAVPVIVDNRPGAGGQMPPSSARRPSPMARRCF